MFEDETFLQLPNGEPTSNAHQTLPASLTIEDFGVVSPTNGKNLEAPALACGENVGTPLSAR